MRTVLIAFLALIIGAGAGVAFGMLKNKETTQRLLGVMQEKDQMQLTADSLQKAKDAAVKKYAQELGKLVTSAGALAQASPAAPTPPAAPAAATDAAAPKPPVVMDDSARLIEPARAVVAARDRYRASVDALRFAMNSDFDALSLELANATPDPQRVRELLIALRQNWPAKEMALEQATRAVMGDLGLLIVPATLKPPVFTPQSASPPQ